MQRRERDRHENRVNPREYQDYRESDQEQQYYQGRQRNVYSHRNGAHPNPLPNMNKKKKDDWDINGLLNFIKAPSKTSREGSKSDYHRGQQQSNGNPTNPVIVRQAAKLYQPQNLQIKQKLDSQMEQYRNRQGRGQQQNSERPNRAHPQQLNKVIENVEQNSDDQDWMLPKEDEVQEKPMPKKIQRKEIVLEQKEFPRPQSANPKEKSPINMAIPRSNRRNNNQIQNICSKQIQQQVQVKKSPQKSSKSPKQETILANLEQSSRSSSDQAESQFPSLDNGHQAVDAHSLSALICNENFIDSRQHQPPPKEQEFSLLTEEEVRQKLASLSKGFRVAILIRFEARQNVLQFRVKEVQLLNLGTTAKVHQTSMATLKKIPQITAQQLSEYIRFKTTRHFYPKILLNEAQTMPLAEGDESYEQIGSIAQFQLCEVKMESMPDKLQKTDKSVIQIRLLMVKCMQCEKKNQVPVILSDYSVVCSCHNCSAKIMGRITSVQLKIIESL